MTEIQPFTFPTTGQPVRTVVLGGEPWFIAKDVCDIVGISKYRDAVARLDADERVSVAMDTPGGPQMMAGVSEAGVYSLMMISRSPAVRPFKRWLTHEVIPSIRKTGGYAVAQFEIPASYADALELAARQARELDAVREHVAEIEPRAQAWDVLGAATGDYSVREAAQILDRDPLISTGQNRLFSYLRDPLGWIDAGGVPYQAQVDCGRLVQRPVSYTHPHKDEPVLTSQVRITVKGLAELHRRLGGFGDVAALVGAAS